jgi:hypothetical protein
MRAKLLGLESSEFDPLVDFTPVSKIFSITVRLLIGIDGSDGEDLFDIQVCSPEWLQMQELPLVGRHMLIVHEFNYHAIYHYLEKLTGNCQGDSWQEIAQRLARFAYWEFEDYR